VEETKIAMMFGGKDDNNGRQQQQQRHVAIIGNEMAASTDIDKAHDSSR